MPFLLRPLNFEKFFEVSECPKNLGLLLKFLVGFKVAHVWFNLYVDVEFTWES